jgi:hypothetical protein
VRDTANGQSGLADLVYELLDAHGDTMRLADALADGLAEKPAWSAHLDYLRGLQRVGRECLARLEPHEHPLR